MVKKPRRNCFAERLKALRTAARLNQIALARLLGVTQVTVSLYESGRREPDLDDLMTIAEKMGTTPNELLGFEPPPLRASAPPREIPSVHTGDIKGNGNIVAVGSHNTTINAGGGASSSSSTHPKKGKSPQRQKTKDETRLQ